MVAGVLLHERNKGLGQFLGIDSPSQDADSRIAANQPGKAACQFALIGNEGGQLGSGLAGQARLGDQVVGLLINGEADIKLAAFIDDGGDFLRLDVDDGSPELPFQLGLARHLLLFELAQTLLHPGNAFFLDLVGNLVEVQRE